MTRSALVVVVALLLLLWPVGTASAGAIGSGASEDPATSATPSQDTLVVDDDGNADYTSIQNAVHQAADGDTVEVRPGTYVEEVTVTKNITLVAPEGATLDGSSLDEADRGILIGRHAAPTIEGFTITNYQVGVSVMAHSTGNWLVTEVTIRDSTWNGFRARYARGDWTIRNSLIADNAGRGVDADESTGDWVIEGTTIRNNDAEPVLDSARGIGVDASESTGDWTIRRSTIEGHVDGAGSGVDATLSSGAWTIEKSVILDHQTGVRASDATGDWTIEGSLFLNASDNAVRARGATGDWEISDTEIGGGRDGVQASETEGAWAIRGTAFRGLDVAVWAKETTGEWTIHDSEINESVRTGVIAEGASPSGDATHNWWGACDGPSGDFEGSGGGAIGNVTVDPFYTDVARQTLSSETSSACGDAPFDFGVELEQETTVDGGGSANVSAFVDNRADESVSGATVELLVDADADGRFDSDEVVADRTVDFAAGEAREVGLEYADVQLAAGTYRYAVRVSAAGGTARSPSNGTLTVEGGPPVRISSTPIRPAPGQSVTFAAVVEDANATIREYEWRVDGEVVASGPETTWTFESAGDHRVSLTVTDDEGERHTTNTTVTVEAVNRSPIARIDANRTIVTGDSDGVAFDATGTTDPDGEIADYAWDFDGDGTTDATGPRPVASFPRDPDQSRTVVVELTVTDADGANDTARLRVTVSADRNQAPTAAFSSSPASPKPGEDVTLDAAAAVDPDGTIQRYEWEFDGNRGVDATGPTVTRDVSTMRENVTLSVTDDEGATDSVTRQITPQVITLNTNTTITINTTVNEPPRPQFDVSPQFPEPDDNVTFTSRSYDPDGNITDYEWYVNGSTVSDERRLPGGGVLPDTRPSDVTVYFDEAGARNVTLVVTDDGNWTNSTTKVVDVRERDDSPTAAVSVASAEPSDPSPNNFEVGESLLLDGSNSSAVRDRSITTYQWAAVQRSGSGYEARYGRSATLTLWSPGTWEVRLTVTDSTGETDRVTKTIEIVERGEIPRIRNVTQDPAGLPLAGVDMDLTYAVDVTAADAIEKVEFERDGQTYVDRDGSDGWTHTLNPKDLAGDQRMTVTVTDAEGDTASKTVAVDVNTPPAWLEAALFEEPTGAASSGPWPTLQRDVEVRTNDRGETVVAFNFTLDKIDFSKSVKAGIEFGSVGYNLDAGGRLVYNMETAMAHADGGYEGGGSVAKVLMEGGVSAQVDATGLVDAREWTIKRAAMRGNASATAALNFTPPIKFGPEFSASVSAGFGLTQRYANRNGRLQTVGGQFRPKLAGRAHAGLWITKWVYFGGTAKLKLVGYFPFGGANTGYGMRARAALEGRYKFGSWSNSLETTFVSNIGDTTRLHPGALRAGRARRSAATLDDTLGGLPSTGISGRASLAGPRRVQSETSGWELENKHRGRPPAGDATAAEALGIDATPAALVGADRLTRDTVADGSPAVAHDGTYTAVWVRQDPSKDVTDGYDVYASTSVDGETWSEPERVTDDRTAEMRPSVAAAGDRRLAAWTRVNASLDGMDGPGDALAHTEVAYAVRDGDGWATPVSLTDDSAVDLEPTVAGSGDRFIVAWVSDPGDVNTTADQQVRFAVVGADGGVGPVRTVQNATDVAVAGADDGGFTLAYARSGEGENGTVVHETVAADGSRTERARYPVRGLTDLAVDDDALAWTTGDGLRFAGDGAPETVPLGNVTGATDIDLLLDGGSPVVTYRASSPGSATPQVRYQRRTSDGWLASRPLIRGGSAGLSALQAGAVTGSEGIVTVAAARNVSRDSHADLFALRQRFAPDLAVAASTDVEPGVTTDGERVRVDYTVRNRGDRAASERVVVALENGSGVVATETLAPLDAGERTSGSFTTSVDAGGTVAVQVDPADDVTELSESNNRATRTVARPDLTVGSVTERREGDDLVVSVDVENRGPVAVGGATVALRSGGDRIADRTVDVREHGRRTVRVRVPVDAVNRSLPTAVVVDPADRVGERDESNNERYERLLGVDLAVSTGQTTAAPDGVLADLFVSNAETGASAARVSLDAGDRTLTYDLPVAGSTDPGTRSFERVRLYHSAEEGSLDVSVAPTGTLDAAPVDNAARTAVTANGSETTPLRVAAVSGTPESDTVAVRVTLDNDDSVAVGAPLTVTLNGTTVVNTTAVVGPDATETASVTLPAGPGTYEAVVTAPGSTVERTVSVTGRPDLTGDGRAATDPDADGLLEDTNGDGAFDVSDVEFFINARDRLAVRENVGQFDFHPDGAVNFCDGVALYLELGAPDWSRKGQLFTLAHRLCPDVRGGARE